MAATRDTQDSLIVETTNASSAGHVRDTSDVLILEAAATGFGHVRGTSDVLILELLDLHAPQHTVKGKTKTVPKVQPMFIKHTG